MAVARNTDVAPSREKSEDTLRPGDALLRGQYRIERHLNSGGFGITYLARDSLDRKVVIKECFPNSMCLRADDMVRARSRALQKDFEQVVKHFGLEARRMSTLEHPNIVGVHQVFEDRGTAYMALDFVEGRDLLDIIEKDRGSLSPADVKDMLLKLLDAIQYVHENDVLHRDISPDNILVDKSGEPVLIDFGAAREVATNASRALSALHIVKDGYSPQEFYLANNSQSASSDLYSLAASFYHVIMGKAPPNSQVRLAALAADEHDPYVPIPPRTEGYDHFFLGAIDRALAVFPKDRLESAVAWIEEIDQARRQRAMKERAKQDQALHIVIRELTIATNKEMAATDAPEQSGAARLKQKLLGPPVEKPVSWDLDDDDDEDDALASFVDRDNGAADWDEEAGVVETAPVRHRRPMWVSLILLPFLPFRLIAGRRRKG